MSPEQAAGELDQLGPASDVYSLGATLYCLLTGRPPFEDRDVDDGPAAGGPRATSRRRGRSAGDVPRALEAICLKAMAPRPEDRYASARALADDVEQLAGRRAGLGLARAVVRARGALGPRGIAPWRRPPPSRPWRPSSASRSSPS